LGRESRCENACTGAFDGGRDGEFGSAKLLSSNAERLSKFPGHPDKWVFMGVA
jgi:hypothetical protein